MPTDFVKSGFRGKIFKIPGICEIANRFFDKIFFPPSRFAKSLSRDVRIFRSPRGSKFIPQNGEMKKLSILAQK
jgi:hypothetical protein